MLISDQSLHARKWHIGELLIQSKLISWDQLDMALEDQKSTLEPIGEILVRRRYISRFLLYQALARQFGMRFEDLSRIHINPRAVDRIPGSIARKYAIMPLELTDGTLAVAVSTPQVGWPIEEIRVLAKVDAISPVLCIPEHVVEAIRTYYPEDIN